MRQLYEWKPTIDISAGNDYAFRIACINGHIGVVRQLYEWRPTIDISADYEYVFRNACRNGHLDVVKQLLEWNPNLNISNIPLTDIKSSAIREYINNFRYTKITWLNTLIAVNDCETMLECPICRTDDLTQYVKTPCGHKYCQGCIKSWLEKSNSCPYCRDNIILTNI